MKRGFFMLAVCLLIFAAGACAMTPSSFEARFGDSYRLQKFNQILNPAASKNLKPVEGLDPQVTEIALEKYRKSFEKPPEPAKFLMEIGANR